MEHFKSTLATTTAIVLGLVLAAHLRNGGVEEPRRMAGPAVAAIATWQDPPSAIQETSSPTWVFDTAAVVVPAVATPMMPGAVAPILPAEIAPPTRRAGNAAAKSKNANRAVRVRQASDGRGQPVNVVAAVSGDESQTQGARPDPIGGLIRGLDDGYGS